jgi:hypothetical protein
MPTHIITPANGEGYQTTLADDHAVDLAAGDNVEVQDGAFVSATGNNAHGIVAAGTSIAHIFPGGIVGSTQGNGITGIFYVFVDPAGRVSGAQFGILFTGGSNTLKNSGAVNGFTGVGIADPLLPQTILNEGSITGTTRHGAELKGFVHLTNTGSTASTAGPARTC